MSSPIIGSNPFPPGLDGGIALDEAPAADSTGATPNGEDEGIGATPNGDGDSTGATPNTISIPPGAIKA